jgi:hypothetical protein
MVPNFISNTMKFEEQEEQEEIRKVEQECVSE